MASIGGVSGGGSGSSIFGNRPVISGLASGMDTESMIENAVSGYKMKISNLQQQRTRLEWQQTAYRSIISKMVSFNQKYLSYASGNNLMSPGFFDSAVKVIAMGANADKVSVTGKSTSNVQVNSITQLATSATYSSTTQNLKPSNVAGESFDINGTAPVGKLDGTMTLGYGGKTVQISFGETDVFNSADEMAAAINKKLENETIAFDGGSSAKASERIRAVADKNGTISFETVQPDDNNGVWIDSADEKIETALGIKTEGDSKTLKSFTFDASKVTEQKSMVDVVNENGFTITLDGVTKTIKGPSKDELGSNWDEAKYLAKLQENIDKEFGAGKFKVSDAGTNASDGKIQLKFEATSNTSKFSVYSSAGKLVGMEHSVSSYVNANRNLGDLLADNGAWDKFDKIKAEGKVTESGKNDGFGTDEKGHRVKSDGNGGWYRVDDQGEALHSFTINGKSVGEFSKNSSLQSVIDAVNNNPNSEVKMSYSQFTGKFIFESKETGAGQDIALGGGLAEALFGGGDPVKKGQDAIFSVTVNGETKDVTQSSNTIEIDGSKITMKGTFAADSEAVTFSSETDTDKIINVVKDMVKDYNEMAAEIKKAYSTMPMQKTNGDYYQPLTDDDMADMSESAIKAYEEKAKTGILFADRDLASLYDGMTRALGVLGKTGNDMNKLGLTISYADGATTMELDESKLREALENDPEKVKDIFTRSTSDGASSDGLMQGLKNQMDKYAGTEGVVKGALIAKAGSPLAPTSVYQNTWQQKLEDYDKQIESWRKKMSTQVDYYNSKFTALEQMVLQMNNQSSLLMGMSGGF